MTRIFAVLLALAASSTWAAEPEIVLTKTERFEVRNLTPKQLNALADAKLRNAVLRVATPAGPGLLGETGISEGVLWFQPMYPLAYDIEHVAIFDPTQLPDGGKLFKLKYTAVRPESKPTVISAVYPSGEKLPENLLKFYVQFSAPMRKGEAYSHVSIRDADGHKIDLPFLELEQELWDSTGTRLTLLIDPGRIKRGLKPREDVGPVFEEGQDYTLEIDATWRDAAGKPLTRGIEKNFHIHAPINQRIDIMAWRLQPPPNVKSGLVLRFNTSLDAALVMRDIRVFDANDKFVAGTVQLGDREQFWKFQPTKPWAPGEYRVRVGTDLEDLAGNRVGRVFDRDEKTPEPKGEPVRERTFRVPAE